MSMPDVNPVIDGVAGRSLPSAVNIGAIVATVLGFGCFAFGLFAIGDGGAYAWGAFLVGLLYTLALGQGGVMFAVIMTGTWGRWGRPVKRIGEAFGFFLPVAWVLLLVFLLFGLKIYSWNPNTILTPADLAPHSPEAIASKEWWLQPGFFIARQLGCLALLIALNMIYLRASIKPDLIMAQERLGSSAPGWWNSVTGGSKDLKGALAAGLKTQAVMVPLLAVAYALIFSLFAFDLIMSLSPWWFSNLFGAWTFATAFWLALSTMGLVAMIGRDWLGLGAFVKPSVTHDIGKLMLAACMFWGYTTFAQLLPIWYTDMPEETDFLLVRMMLPEWSWLAQAVGVTCFAAPFTILLSRGIKKMRWPFAGICGLVMVGIFLERSLLVLPSVWFGDFPRPDLIVVSVGTWIGFLGLFTLVVGQVLARIPPLVISDPYLEPHPWDVHVHSLDHGHH